MNMKQGWKEVKLGEVCRFVKDRIAMNDIANEQYVSTENMIANKGGIEKPSSIPDLKSTQAFKKCDVLVSNIRPYFKKIWYAVNEGGCSNDVLVFRANKDIDSRFLYYVLSEDCFFDYSTASAKGTKMPRGDKSALVKYPLPLPPLATQRKIAKILSAIDEKIDVNRRMNENLEEQARAIFQAWFVDGASSKFEKCRMDNCFDISIGKTPPRKEPEWFSLKSEDCAWVSISDMGNSGMFISRTSECLNWEAVKRFNVNIAPDNTVLLSFKLTVGRVVITDGLMATNEAIAQFKTNNKEVVEYLYCYLKNFRYETMGSTSSIATAVNSKMVRAMEFLLPSNEDLIKFHKMTNPMFLRIKQNLQESSRLASLRDTLLPRLMSGELDVDGLDLEGVV